MPSYDPRELHIAKRQGYITAAVGPRPIAFASTIDKEGRVNLAPYSFFNAFSAEPPMMVFSSNRSGRTGETKDTYKNIKEVPEVVINVVTYDMVQQVSYASSEFDRGVNEFVKAGFTQLESETVKPPRVAESPVQFECEVKEVIELGDQGGAGNLFLCEIKRMHIADEILNEEGRIDQAALDLVGRSGANWYVRVNEDSLFEVQKPSKPIGIGFDNFPESVLKSEVLSANDLGILASVPELPTEGELKEFQQNNNPPEGRNEAHEIAKSMISNGQISEAWKLLLSIES